MRAYVWTVASRLAWRTTRRRQDAPLDAAALRRTRATGSRPGSTGRTCSPRAAGSRRDSADFSACPRPGSGARSSPTLPGTVQRPWTGISGGHQAPARRRLLDDSNAAPAGGATSDVRTTVARQMPVSQRFIDLLNMPVPELKRIALQRQVQLAAVPGNGISRRLWRGQAPANVNRNRKVHRVQEAKSAPV
jgi:hypothetical protein